MTNLRQVIPGLKKLFQTHITFPRLMTGADRVKLKNYDTLASNVAGLQQALDTQQRALDEAHRKLDVHDEAARKLQTEYAQMQQRLAQTAASGSDASLIDVFRRLQPAAIQLPTIRSFVAAGAQISAADVLGIVAPLEEMLRDFGFETIGEANQDLPFDPRYHQMTGAQSPAPVVGEPVRVRYVGYRYKGKILCKAEVSRIEQIQSV